MANGTTRFIQTTNIICKCYFFTTPYDEQLHAAEKAQTSYSKFVAGLLRAQWRSDLHYSSKQLTSFVNVISLRRLTTNSYTPQRKRRPLTRSSSPACCVRNGTSGRIALWSGASAERICPNRSGE